MNQRSGAWVAAVLFLFLTATVSWAQLNRPVLDELKGREWKYRDSTGEVSLGKIMTIQYAPYTVAVDPTYQDALVQLAEALNVPGRSEYRIVVQGYTDSSGSPASNRKISLKRAQALKELMIRNPSMALDADRIEVEGLGSANPVASNATRTGRDRNRRVEIHVYGNVREALRTIDQAPPPGTDGEPVKARPAIAGAGAAASTVTAAAGVQSSEEPDTIRMSLFDAIRYGLESNQEIRVVSFSPKQAQEGVADAESVFDPSFFTDGTFRRDPNLQSSVADIVMEDDGVVETGIRQPLPTGGSLSGALSMRYSDLDGAALERTYKYTFSPTLEIRQPLLKNIGAREEKAAISIANHQLGISNEEFRRKVIDIATRISKSYWQLYLLREYVVIDRQNFEMADEVFRRETVRMKQGLSQRLDVERARSNAERRRGNLINAQERHRVGMDQLKLLINWSDVNIGSDVNIAPVDEPDTVTLDVQLQAVMEKAFQNRPEILQAKQQVDIRRVEEDLSNHLRLPTLDVFGSYGATGYGREFSDSVSDTAVDRNDIWAAGLTFEYPIGNRSAKAKMRKTKYARRQSEEQVTRVRDQIKQEIKQVLTTIDYAGSEIRSTRMARDSAKKVVEGEFARFEIGQTTNEELLRAQDLFAATSRIFIRSVVDYNIALAELMRVQGELPDGLSIEGLGESEGN